MPTGEIYGLKKQALFIFKSLNHCKLPNMQITRIALIFIALLSTLPVIAQSQQTGPFVFKADGGGVHQSEADLKDSDGGFAVDRWFVSAGIDYGWSQRESLGLSIGGGRSIYEFNDLTEFGEGGPWDTIEDARISITGRWGFGNTGSAIIIPTVRSNGEKGAKSGDSTTYGLFAAAAWRLNEDLTIGPGIGVFTRLENGTRIFPVLAIDWNINERWNLSTGRGLASSQGPGLTLSDRLNQNWSFGLAGRYEDVEFRLDDEGVAPGGVGRDQSIPLVVTAIMKPNQMLSLSVFAGIEFNGKLRLKDAVGDDLEESSYDPAPLFGATFEFRY